MSSWALDGENFSHFPCLCLALLWSEDEIQSWGQLLYTFHGKPIWPFLCISQKFSDFLDRNCEHRETFMLVPAAHLVYSMCQMGFLSSARGAGGGTHTSVGLRNFPVEPLVFGEVFQVQM